MCLSHILHSHNYADSPTHTDGTLVTGNVCFLLVQGLASLSGWGSYLLPWQARVAVKHQETRNSTTAGANNPSAKSSDILPNQDCLLKTALDRKC